MRPSAAPQSTQDRLVARFRSADATRSRSRSVSDVVLSARLEVPVPPARLTADWARDVGSRLQLEPGDVQALPLPRARARWPDYGQCVQAMSDWTGALGLHDILGSSDVALMACRGARYHHDGEQYGSAAFCNLFLSEDVGLEVHFAATGHRIPLARGTALIFDTGQPHAVVRRGRTRFDVADFEHDPDCTQVFLTWELPIEHAEVARALRIVFDVDPSTSLQADDEQIWRNGERVGVCPASGRWLNHR